MDGDVPFVSRQGEEEVFAITWEPEEGAEDRRSEEYVSQFLNDSGPRMEPERSVEAQTNTECDNDLQISGPPQSGEVY